MDTTTIQHDTAIIKERLSLPIVEVTTGKINDKPYKYLFLAKRDYEVLEDNDVIIIKVKNI